MFLSFLSGAFGWLVGALCADIGGSMVSLTVIAMGGCVIYTINKNFAQLRKDLKNRGKPTDPENL